MKIGGFDWDEGNRQKCQKHGLSLAEIEEALISAGHTILPDERHSAEETRHIAIGRTSAGRLAFIAFTFREKAGRLLMRPISARFMHDKEVRKYEQEIAPLLRR